MVSAFRRFNSGAKVPAAPTRDRAAVTARKSSARISVLVALIAFPASPVFAGTVNITCAKADVMAGGSGPMTVTYDGEATGMITIASGPVNLSVPANKTVRTGTLDGKPHSVTGIIGASDGAIPMPDRLALEACASKNIQPEFKDDADMYAVALLSCVSSTPLAAAPVNANASVNIALVSNSGGGEDVVVEIKRTFLDKSAVPGGTISIETFPGDCALADK